MQAKKGKNLQLSFPIRVEGSGKLSIGSNSKIDKNVYFGIGKGGKIIIGKNCRIDSGVQIIAGTGASIIIGDNCWIMQNSIIRSKNSEFKINNNVIIATQVQIFSREEGYEGSLLLKEGVRINDYVMLDITHDLIINEEVVVGQYSIIFTHDHNYKTSNRAVWKGEIELGTVLIDAGTWIGAKTVIMKNVKIGKRALIASGAIVTKDCQAQSIYAGVPAKKIKSIID